jgi:hypothetical protein
MAMAISFIAGYKTMGFFLMMGLQVLINGYFGR